MSACCSGQDDIEYTSGIQNGSVVLSGASVREKPLGEKSFHVNVVLLCRSGLQHGRNVSMTHLLFEKKQALTAHFTGASSSLDSTSESHRSEFTPLGVGKVSESLFAGQGRFSETQIIGLVILN